MNTRCFISGSLFFLFSVTLLPAKIIYVDLNATGNGDGTSWQNAYTSIYPAVAEAVSDDEVIVAPGVYLPNPRYGPIDFGGKNITLRSTDPTSLTVRQTTIIEGNTSDYAGIQLSGAEGPECLITGFTIRKCRKDGGGAISGKPYGAWDAPNSRATIRYNILSNNSSQGYGGAIFNCDGLIEYNVIENNTCQQFGGALSRCNGTIRFNTIRGNVTPRSGGGLDTCQGTIQCNVIVNNKASENGGGGLYECHGTIANNIITGNFADSSYGTGGGLYYCNGLIINNTIVGNVHKTKGGGLGGCRGKIINCLIWNNYNGSTVANPQFEACAAPTYSCIQNWTGGQGNTNVNPKVVNLGSWTGTPGTGTWNQGNYYLLRDSPCIDHGLNYYLCCFPLTDYEGRVRIAGLTVDIGAFEYDGDADSDGDLIADADEAAHGTQSNNMDSDADGLPDGIEVLRGTNPAIANTPPGLAVKQNYTTVQEAIWYGFPGETITVQSGTYPENIHFLGKNLVLQSSAGAASTILDGGRKGSVATFLGNESGAAIMGFTITHGESLSKGGGVHGNGAAFALTDNIITSNSAVNDEGGGVSDCSGPITGNVISDNYAYDIGGGLAYCHDRITSNTIERNVTEYNGGGAADCDGTISLNLIINNHADGYEGGGGLYYCDGWITQNLIQGNTADNTEEGGGGLYYCGAVLIADNIITGNSALDAWGGGMYDCSGLIANNIITGNRAYAGGGIASSGDLMNNTIVGNYASSYGGGVNYPYEFRNNIVWGNLSPASPQIDTGRTITYNCVQDWMAGGQGNIAADPQFIRNGAWSGEPGSSKWTDGDYHLRPSSPCVDAGAAVAGLTQDFDGDLRGFNSIQQTRGDGSDYDIGADECLTVFNSIHHAWNLYP